MADAIVSMALERLAAIAEEKVREEINLVRGVKKEVDYLFSKLKTMRDVLEDAERRRYKDKTVQNWLKKLEDVSYDVDDVLDEWNFVALKLQTEGSEAFPSPMVRSFIPSSCIMCFNKIATSRSIAKKIKGLKERVNVILSEKDEFDFIVNQPIDSQESAARVQSVSLVDVSDVHGRADDKEVLVSKLIMHEVAGQQLQAVVAPHVISIVGVGGIGKTTLAQLVYNDDRLVSCFELKIWVCVSDVFDEVRIAKAILESVKKESSNVKELESLLNHLKDSILGRKFLLVLDDVWTEDSTKWEPFKNTLNYGASGSKILVTTRSERVARMLGSVEIHHLGQLSDTDSWLLMKRVVFYGRSEADYEELQEIGKKITNKCKGLPLAVKVLGSLLRFKDTKEEWGSILDNEIWQLEEAEVNLFPHLFLSYNELSPAMKRCFSYSAFFPKDWVIDVDMLIRMWMALGYLGSTESTGNLELRGKEYFNNLRMRCFFQDIEEDGNRVRCKMHDIVHDFAQFLSKTKRHNQDGKAEAKTNASSLVSQVEVYRTIFCEDEIPCEIFDFARRARILSLSECGLQDIPRGLKKLIHLRYLELAFNYGLTDEVSQTICQLYNLQTLNLSNCRLEKLPREIKNLVALRYLDLGHNRLKEIPREVGKLTELRYLDLGSNELIEITNEIGNLIQLRYLDLGNNKLTEMPMEIRNLIELRYLDLRANKLKEMPKEIGNLIELRFLYLGGNKLNEVQREIGNLSELRLLDLVRNKLKEIPREIGNLIYLRDLYLGLNELKELPREIGNLIRLRHLDLIGNKVIKELPETICNLCDLQTLYLSDCASLCRLPQGMERLVNLRHLQNSDCILLSQIPQGIEKLTGLETLRLFYGGRGWSKLGYLKELDRLSRSLVLKMSLHDREDVGEARKARLMNKIHIRDLDILFIHDAMGRTEEDDLLRNEALEALHPPPNLTGLTIYGHQGTRFPSWMSCPTPQPLNHLKRLHIQKCNYVSTLPCLGKLPELVWLRVSGMASLKFVGREFLGIAAEDMDGSGSNSIPSSSVVISFPKLFTLIFNDCPRWKEWEDMTAKTWGRATTTIVIMPHLQNLEIHRCGLTELPYWLRAASPGSCSIGMLSG